MRIFFNLVLLPLALQIIASLITECLIRLADERDKKQ